MENRAIVTGASGAIGGAVATRLLQDGARVALLCHQNPAAAMIIADAHPGRAAVFAGDLAAPGCPAVQNALDWLGGVDMAAFCAGVSRVQLFCQTAPQDMSALINTNLTGTMLAMQPVLAHMVANHTGSVVVIGSVWGSVGASMESVYSATKGALHTLVRALAKEEGYSGVRINCISPGFIQSKMNSCFTPQDIAAIQQETPLSRLGTPQDIAAAAAFLLGEQSSFITGQVLTVDGGWTL